jgi:hypothetical protein
MPVQEQATKQVVIMALVPVAIGSNTTTTGTIIDTADFDLGVYFVPFITAWTDGTFTLKIEDGDNSGLSDAAVVSSDQLVYKSLPALAAADVVGSTLSKEGVHSTKRYVRASIVSTGVTTGATVGIIAINGAELCPTAQG